MPSFLQKINLCCGRQRPTAAKNPYPTQHNTTHQDEAMPSFQPKNLIKKIMRPLLPRLLAASFSIVSLLLFVQNAFAQTQNTMPNKSYATLWKAVDSLERQGLTKSALEQTLPILAKAEAEKNYAQLLKTLMYKGKYDIALTENGDQALVDDWEGRCTRLPQPARSVLQSMLAQYYTNYIARNQYTMQDRTELSQNAAVINLATTTIGVLQNRASELYSASLTDATAKTTPIKDYEAILTEGKNTQNLRPFLYDYLAHRALDFFGNEQNYLAEPEYKYELSDIAAFGNAAAFAKRTFATNDANARKYIALQVFQKLTAYHLGNDAALLDVELARLKFVDNTYIGDDKAVLYKKSLENLAKAYENKTGYAEIINAIVDLKMADAAKYEPLKDDANAKDLGNLNLNQLYKNEYKSSVELLDRAMRTDAASWGHDLCAAKKMQILQKSLTIETEHYNTINKPILAKISYKNVNKLFYRVVKYDKTIAERIQKTVQEKNKVKYADNYFMDELLALTPIQTGAWTVIDDGDYQSHSTEAKLDGLGSDTYMLLVGDRSEMTTKATAVSYAQFSVSNLTYFEANMPNGSIHIWVADRISGAPIANAEVQVFELVYNPQTYQNDRKSLTNIMTDKNGLAVVDLKQKSFSVIIKKGNDLLDNSAQHYNYNEQQEPTTQKTIQFFTDRAIYRPDQIVYFKALLTQNDKKDLPSIVTKEPIEVFFHNTNGEVVARQSFTTNDFGTINGNFTAPNGGLLGGMSLHTDYGDHYIQVEEYKRPKFEVTFDTLKGNYRLNEKVEVKGLAKAFAGNAIDNAKVTYRVTRQAQFPYYDFWSYWRRPSFNTNAQEIAHGELVTDAEGKFTISFEAKPDASIPKSEKPTFTYSVSVDVVDGNGELRIKETGTTIGYTSLILSINTGANLDKTKAQDLKITTNNLNGVHLPTKGKLALYALKMPTVTYKNRLWTRPDMQILAKADFEKAFPTIPYKAEDQKDAWDKGTAVWSSDFDTKDKANVKLPSFATYKTGTYLLIATANDASGEVIESKQFFDIFTPKDKKPSAPISASASLDKAIYQPNETAILSIASSRPLAHAFVQVENADKILLSKWVILENSSTKIEIPIKEEHRGNLSYNIIVLADNRAQEFPGTINVPWTNKDLTVEYTTFRNKLTPGQDEEWRVTIKGDKKDKVLAEVLATMYDASLNEFAENNFERIGYPLHYARMAFQYANNYGTAQGNLYHPAMWQPNFIGTQQKTYSQHNWFELLYANYNRNRYMQRGAVAYAAAPAMAMGDASMPAPAMTKSVNANAEKTVGVPPPVVEEPKPQVEDKVFSFTESSANNATYKLDTGKDATKSKPTPPAPPQIRTNLKETVFFYPNLMTDKDGNVVIKFKMNEALTKWKFMLFAHTKDLQNIVSNKEIVTQKDLMVMPNPPRFLRAGDEIEFVSKIANLTATAMTGTAELQLENAVTGKPISEFGSFTVQNFTATAGQSAFAKWTLRIPETFTDAVTWRVIAKSANASDGEENVLPTLTNRQLVTETMPLPIRSLQTKNFTFAAMQKASESNTLTHQGFTLEFTPNPAWYAVQALPYIMEYPYDCTEQLFSRMYANALATTIVKKQPQIEKIFNAWRNTDALESNLSKNQALKSALLAETPWVLDAKNEAQQKKNIALLFDLNKMASEKSAAFAKIQTRQLSNGGFAWFTGGQDNWYITQYLVEGFGHLNKLGALDLAAEPEMQDMLNRAIEYCDNAILKDYDELKQRVAAGKAKMEDDNLGAIHIQYMYARSFFRDVQLPGKYQEAIMYYEDQAQKQWTKRSEYEQGMLALAMHRRSRASTSVPIIKSLKERVLNNEEMGAYWKYPSGYYWYQAPIETHALMIEVFTEAANDTKMVDDLKTWLLKNKQTNAWKSTKSTASAIYALLIGGDNLLAQNEMPDITVGDYTIKTMDSKVANVKVVKPEAGSGYFKLDFEKSEIKPNFVNIAIKNNNKVVAWGAAYWQYFEKMDKIKAFVETPIKITKELYREDNTPEGKKLSLITDKNTLKVGDKVKMRIVLSVDRGMEFVHLKDGRAATMEPQNTVSGYKYQGGLGYYEETRDAATNFFFDYLPKGTYVFEYPLTIQHKGEFSCGIATLQSMYAPEFTSHTEGVRIKVE
jgi:uncharacterized protein YfaS (alpha-2-macroglobulin family)